ncbi:MAG TPA: LapA family protein [Nitrospirota bacterium]|nr:LapA family protein [Nitrospirota bacterium]
MISLILLLLIIVAVAAFSVQNAAPVAVSFLSWHFEASLALVIVISLLAGLIVGVALLSFVRLRQSLRVKRTPDRSQLDTEKGRTQ